MVPSIPPPLDTYVHTKATQAFMLVSHMMEVLVECRMKYHGKMLLSCHFKSNMDHFWAISGGQGVICNFFSPISCILKPPRPSNRSRAWQGSLWVFMFLNRVHQKLWEFWKTYKNWVTASHGVPGPSAQFLWRSMGVNLAPPNSTMMSSALWGSIIFPCS